MLKRFWNRTTALMVFLAQALGSIYPYPMQWGQVTLKSQDQKDTKIKKITCVWAEQRSLVIGMMQAATGQSAVSRHFICSQPKIVKLPKQYEETVWRPFQVWKTKCDDHQSKMYHCLATPAGPAAHTAAVTTGHHHQGISKSTIWSYLKKHSLNWLYSSKTMQEPV